MSLENLGAGTLGQAQHRVRFPLPEERSLVHDPELPRARVLVSFPFLGEARHGLAGDARFLLPLSNYNPGAVQGTLGDWGSLTFTFTDCNDGTASWNSTVAGYGDGSIPITRVTSIQGTSCPQ